MDARIHITRQTAQATRSLAGAAGAGARQIGRYTIRVRPTFVRLARPAAQPASGA